jgi:hypothetical protein
MCFVNLSVQAYLEEDEPFSTLKTVICRKHFVQKLSSHMETMC